MFLKLMQRRKKIDDDDAVHTIKIKPAEAYKFNAIFTWAEQVTRSLRRIIVSGLDLGNWVDLAFLCDVPAYTRELTNFKAFQVLSWFETQIVSLSVRKVDYLLLFEVCGMRKKLLRCNLQNIPQVKFRKIHLFKFLHSAFCRLHLPSGLRW